MRMLERKRHEVVGLVRELLSLAKEFEESESRTFDQFLIRSGVPERTVRRYRSLAEDAIDMASFVVKRREKCLEEERVKLSSLTKFLVENCEGEFYRLDGTEIMVCIISAIEKKMKEDIPSSSEKYTPAPKLKELYLESFNSKVWKVTVMNFVKGSQPFTYEAAREVAAKSLMAQSPCGAVSWS
jgi:hypothetical protein